MATGAKGLAPRVSNVEGMLEVQLVRALRWQREVFTWVLADSGLEPCEYHALIHLDAREGVRQNELGMLLVRSKVATSRLLAALERKGLVERRDDREDTRSKRVRLTRKGQELLKRARRAQEATSALVARGMTKAERAALVRLLDKLRAGYRAAAEMLKMPLPEEP